MKDIFKRAEQCISLSLIEKYFATKGAKHDRTRGEYYTRSPLRKDDNVKSGTFSISPSSGLWNDLSNGDSGNFIQLVSKAFGLTMRDAAQKILDDVGAAPVTPPAPTTTKPKKLPAIIPIPKDEQSALETLVQSKYNLDAHGTPRRIYTYKNISGDSVFCVCRYEKTDDAGNINKEHIPYFFSSKGWKAGRPDIEKFPLFGEHKLAGNVLPVLVVEGEKCAAVEVNGAVVLSWLGGTQSAKKSDWSVLEGREVLIWPDADKPGHKAAAQIKVLVPQSDVLDIQGKPQGWDIADAVAEGVNPAEFMKKCPRILARDMPVTPYETFIHATEELYGVGNLEQFDGLYYIYTDTGHYWQETLTINIEADIQKWVEKNQIPYLDETDQAVHTFMRNTVSFLRRYSTTYYAGNPFKDSCLQPYIHVKNGAIEITDEGFQFHDRTEKPETFFRALYPMHCLDFDFDLKHYRNKNLQKRAPAFYHYIKTLVPLSETPKVENDKIKYEKEMKLTEQFFSQIIAYTLNPIKRRPHFFAMYGSQDSGKSFLVGLLETIIGEQFFLTRKIKDMDNRFAASDLWGSKVFLDDDVKANITLPDDFIKFYSGQKFVTIEKKNKDAIKGVKISVAMFFISNHAFTIAGGAEGLERRLVYIPYKKRLKNPDVFLLDKIIGKKPKGRESGDADGKTFDERPAIIGLALRGLELLIKNNHNFVTPEWIQYERKQWIIKSNTVTQFINEELFQMLPSDGTDREYRPKELHDLYKEWCKDEDRKPFGKNKFYEMMKLDPAIEFYHRIYGDTFIVKNDGEARGKVEEDFGDIPF